MFKKPLIIFEGVEGSGKTFHINEISKFLKKKRFNILKLENLVGLTIQKKLEI